jgi:integrase
VPTGLSKRCECLRSRWSKCPHPWHLHVKFRGRDYKRSVNRWLELPSDHVINQQEAKGHLDRFRVLVREGQITLGGSNRLMPSDARLTFGAFCDIYLKEHVERPEHSPSGQQLMKWHIKTLRETQVPAGRSELPLESVPLPDLNRAHIEAVRKDALTRPAAKGGRVGANRLLMRLRAMLNWAIAADYLKETPFKRNGSVTVIKLDRAAESNRTRRLHVGEEQRLIEAADEHLKAMIIAALQTGCRREELLDLQWYQVSLERNVINIPASKAKSKRSRDIPITSKLRAVLEMRRTDSLGDEFPQGCFVFGNAVGERVQSIRKQWDAARLIAHGFAPEWRRGRLTAQSRQHLQTVGLHFHDLRRECGSRLIEAGVNLAAVRDWLGHRDVSTTDRYLATDGVRLQEAARRLETSELTLSAPTSRSGNLIPSQSA